jgi:hypothetical protein
MTKYSALLKWSAPTVVIAVLCVLAGPALAKPAHHTRAPGRRHSRGARPGKPIGIGAGFRPEVLVDDAGVAHITYSSPSEEHGPAGEHTYTAGWDNYCRLARGARSCGDDARFDAPITYPPKNGDSGPFFENSPGLNQDIGEGSLPLSTGNQLAILTHRPGNVVEVPGGTSTDVNYLWTSDDGGKKFTGPGLTSTMDYYGGAVTYGNPSSIGISGTTGELIGEEKTLGHVFFQEVPAGSFAPAGARVDLGRGANDLLARRQIAADGSRPLVAWDNLEDVIVREYKGKGDIDDASNWSTSKFPGVDPSLASGPHGTWLTYYPPGGIRKGVVVKLVDGHRSGPITALFPPVLEGEEDQLAEAADGELAAAWVVKDPDDENYRRAMLSTSKDGRHWSKPEVLDEVGRHDQIAGLEIAVGPDGGGVAVFVHGGLPGEKVNVGTLFGIGGQVTAVPFGARGSTGKKGLGTKSSGQSGCLDIRFGAVHAHVDSGCFLQLIDKKHPGGDASIAYGGVHVNGLELRPDSPGAAIVIDSAAHTIESEGGSTSVPTPGHPRRQALGRGPGREARQEGQPRRSALLAADGEIPRQRPRLRSARDPQRRAGQRVGVDPAGAEAARLPRGDRLGDAGREHDRRPGARVAPHRDPRRRLPRPRAARRGDQLDRAGTAVDGHRRAGNAARRRRRGARRPGGPDRLRPR